MLDLICRGVNPAYNDLMAAASLRRPSRSGIRALAGLGLIGVRRSPRQKGCKQYEQNQYWLEGDWLRWEPGRRLSARAMHRAGQGGAKAARKGGEDISTQPIGRNTEPVEKTESGKRRSETV